MENTKQTTKAFSKRNFYTIKDSGVMFVFALILPFLAGIVFAYLSMFIAIQAGVEFAQGSDVIGELFDKYLWFAIPYMLLTQVVFILLWLGYHKTNKISYNASSCSFKSANIWTALLSALAGIVCVFGFIWLIEGCFGNFFDFLGMKSNSPSLPLDSIGWLFANLLILGVVPAICEELIFRGVIFHGLRQQFSATSSILICGLLFALMHQSLLQFIYPLILGCVLSFVMEKTGNLLYTILIHMFNNFTTIVLSYLNNVGAITLSFVTTWWGWICAILVAGATLAALWVIYWFYLKKQQKYEIKQEGQVKQNPPVMVGKFPMTLICGMLLTVILIVINAVG